MHQQKLSPEVLGVLEALVLGMPLHKVDSWRFLRSLGKSRRLKSVRQHYWNAVRPLFSFHCDDPAP